MTDGGDTIAGTPALPPLNIGNGGDDDFFVEEGINLAPFPFFNLHANACKL